MKKSLIISVSIAVVLVIALSITLGVVMGGDKQLETPTGVTASESGLITWNAVENADGYVVAINGNEYQTTQTSYQVQSVINDFTYGVKATATKKYKDSEYSEIKTFKGKGNPEPKPPVQNISVAIEAPDQIYSGASAKLKAKVSGTIDVSVTWAIVEGGEFATIDNKGNLTANEVSGDKVIKVEARSKVDTKAFAQKVIAIVSQPTLTQEMLDALNSEFISFSGYVSIDLYNDTSVSGSETLEGTYTSVIKTAMNGVNWYSEYENGTTGLNTPIYYKKQGDVACQVGVSLLNQEEYFPMTDDFGNIVSWEDSGLYNSLCNLSVSDFTFDRETWRYVYSGSDQKLVERVIASANPYDFNTTTFALIIDEGEIAGIYSKSKPDYTIQVGYKAIQHLYAIVTVGEDFVEVPTINKFATDEDWHPQLNQAIANMQALESYTVEFTDLNVSLYTGAFTQSGFKETITKDLIHFEPFVINTATDGSEHTVFQENGDYGYKVMRDGLYNAYFNDGKGNYQASRAYAGDISKTKPTFAFAAEIFQIPYPEEDGSITYYVNDAMCSVASTLFYGVGNDINLYGIFAARGYISESESFTPFITIKDGYIQEACFYYNIGGLLYGVVELKYSDFNTASVPAENVPEFEVREIPTSWDQLEIIVSAEGGSTADDIPVNALTYFKDTMFKGSSDIEAKLPFFGEVLGDTYGFGLTTYYRPEGQAWPEPAVVLYYDVPLDIDYTINTSLEAVKEYLRDEGFTQTSWDTFVKDEIVVVPHDENLDFMIYIYKSSTPTVTQ